MACITLVRRLAYLFLAGFTLICFGLVLYVTAFRWIDQKACVSSAAQRLGIEETYDGIERYILANAVPGMTREETLGVLGRIGETRVIFSSYNPASTRTRDTISTRFCLHPLNNLHVFAFFDLHGRLVSVDFPTND